MAKLPEILVKEFVRMTNDTTKKKSESFLYGTVDKVNEDGTVDVIFDGADSSTPCTSSVSVAAGDRVLAMLKNRQAVVTSNISNPSINTEALEAGTIKARRQYLIDCLIDDQIKTVNFATLEYEEAPDPYSEEGDTDKLILYMGDYNFLRKLFFLSYVEFGDSFICDGSAHIDGNVDIGSMEEGYCDIHLYPGSSLGSGRVIAPYFYGTLNPSSDRSLKHDICDAEETDALEKLNKIKHRQFVWNKDNKKESLGYIAQELEEIDPDLTTKSEGLTYINLLHLVALATKSIQELSTKVDMLERRVEELESKCNSKSPD